MVVLERYKVVLNTLCFNQAPDMNPGQARYMCCPKYALSNKAKHELDYQVPRIEKCIEDALSWYRANGFHI